MNGVVALNEEAPVVYPMPFELHFSVAHLNWWKESPDDYVAKRKGTDKDLAAHFTIINRYGIALYGASVSEVFGPVPKRDYIDSIWYDVKGAQEERNILSEFAGEMLKKIQAYKEGNGV